MNFALLAAFLLDGSQAPSVFYDGVLQERATSTAGITNIVSTNDAITVSVSNLEARIGMTSTPIFAESDPVWTAASNSYATIGSLPYGGSNVVQQYILANTSTISGAIGTPPAGYTGWRFWFLGYGTNEGVSAEVSLQLNGVTNSTNYINWVISYNTATPVVTPSAGATGYKGIYCGRTMGTTPPNRTNSVSFFETRIYGIFDTNFPVKSAVSTIAAQLGPGTSFLNAVVYDVRSWFSLPNVATGFVVRFEVGGQFRTNSMWGWSYLP